jgi:hypothetical protein
MAEEVDELFGAGGGQPKPRTALITALVFGGLVASVLGLVCSALPGVLVLLAAMSVAETEHDRIDSGYLSADSAARVKLLRGMAWTGVVCGLVLLIVQSAILLRTDIYEVVWGGFIDNVLLPVADRLLGVA